MVKNEFQIQEVSSRGHKRSAAEAFNRDLSKVLIELITNSCDSYKRLEKTEIKSKKAVKINYDERKKIIEITDNGGGINYNKKNGEKCFKDIMKKGERTSGRSEGYATRGFHGIGLKDVCISMSDNKNVVELISIKNEKISQINYGFDKERKNYGYWPIKKDIPVEKRDREKCSIDKNGFYIKFKVPKDWNFPEIGKIITKLKTHRELRKIFEIGEFQIYLNSKLLIHETPIGDLVDSGNFEIGWKKKKFKINYSIKLSKYPLEQKAVAWRDRIGGILVYHSTDAVLDLSLFSFNNNDYATRIFGELEITSKKLEDMDMILEDGLVDEKRKGLDLRKDLNKKMIKILEEKLKIVVDKEKEKERGKNKDISKDRESQRILKDINNLIKSEIGKATSDSPDVPAWRPVDKPFSFFPSNTEVLIKELEKRKIYIIVKEALMSGDEIELQIDNKDIKIYPSKIDIKKESFDEEGYLLKKITLFSEKKDSFGTLTAKSDSDIESIPIRVIENAKINPKMGFSFIPPKIKIIEGKRKFIELIFDERQINFGTELKLTSSSKDIQILKSPNKIQRSYSSEIKENIHVLKIGVYGEKAGISGKISALAGNSSSEVLIEVVEEREIKRKNYLEKIEFSEKTDPVSISTYDENEKTLWIYLKHPVILQHRRNVGEDIKISAISSQGLVLLLADIITRTVASLMAKEYNKKIIGEMQASSHNDFELTFNEMYRKHGLNLSKAFYDIVVNYMNSQIEDTNSETRLEDLKTENEY